MLSQRKGNGRKAKKGGKGPTPGQKNHSAQVKKNVISKKKAAAIGDPGRALVEKKLGKMKRARQSKDSNSALVAELMTGIVGSREQVTKKMKNASIPPPVQPQVQRTVGFVAPTFTFVAPIHQSSTSIEETIPSDGLAGDLLNSLDEAHRERVQYLHEERTAKYLARFQSEREGGRGNAFGALQEDSDDEQNQMSDFHQGNGRNGYLAPRTFYPLQASGASNMVFGKAPNSSSVKVTTGQAAFPAEEKTIIGTIGENGFTQPAFAFNSKAVSERNSDNVTPSSKDELEKPVFQFH